MQWLWKRNSIAFKQFFDPIQNNLQDLTSRTTLLRCYSNQCLFPTTRMAIQQKCWCNYAKDIDKQGIQCKCSCVGYCSIIGSYKCLMMMMFTKGWWWRWCYHGCNCMCRWLSRSDVKTKSIPFHWMNLLTSFRSCIVRLLPVILRFRSLDCAQTSPISIAVSVSDDLTAGIWMAKGSSV